MVLTLFEKLLKIKKLRKIYCKIIYIFLDIFLKTSLA